MVAELSMIAMMIDGQESRLSLVFLTCSYANRGEASAADQLFWHAPAAPENHLFYL